MYIWLQVTFQHFVIIVMWHCLRCKKTLSAWAGGWGEGDHIRVWSMTFHHWIRIYSVRNALLGVLAPEDMVISWKILQLCTSLSLHNLHKFEFWTVYAISESVKVQFFPYFSIGRLGVISMISYEINKYKKYFLNSIFALLLAPRETFSQVINWRTITFFYVSRPLENLSDVFT